MLKDVCKPGCQTLLFFKIKINDVKSRNFIMKKDNLPSHLSTIYITQGLNIKRLDDIVLILSLKYKATCDVLL